MLASQMNGAELPFLNGYPLRLVVPGYFGTYWIKHLSEIEVVDTPFEGYWMSSAYRMPDNTAPASSPAPAAGNDAHRPVQRALVHHQPQDDARFRRAGTVVRGIAFDGGQGIAEVAFSADGGQTWQPAQARRKITAATRSASGPFASPRRQRHTRR